MRWRGVYPAQHLRLYYIRKTRVKIRYKKYGEYYTSRRQIIDRLG